MSTPSNHSAALQGASMPPPSPTTSEHEQDGTHTPQNLTRKLLSSHLVEGRLRVGEEIALRVEQTLSPDPAGPRVCATVEAIGGGTPVQTETSVQYVDHNILQLGPLNATNHDYLEEMCSRLGIWFSRPGNGISHCVHMARFGIPGKLLAGADSHTPSAGALGMLAICVPGIELATVMLGQPLYIRMPEVFGVRMTNRLPDWVSAKDVILTMLRRHGVRGASGRIIEYYGPGVAQLSCTDRHVIANMGTEMGAVSSLFPSDESTRRYLELEGRESDWTDLRADPDAAYDVHDEIDLSTVEPLIALPGSPANVQPVGAVEPNEIRQVVIGSSANSGLRDYVVASQIVEGVKLSPRISLDINPSSRQMLMNLAGMGALTPLLEAGARLHQAGCLGCTGIGQSLAPGQISLRTMPRNYYGRSGTADDQVYLCSPETAAASAVTGRITDPRVLAAERGMAAPSFRELALGEYVTSHDLLVPPGPRRRVRVSGDLSDESSKMVPRFDPIPDDLIVTVMLKVSDDVSTDTIMPGGEKTLSLRSDIPAISEYVFMNHDSTYVERAKSAREVGGHAIIAGSNYGQGSAREPAAAAPRYLGLRCVLAVSYARIHFRNLVNYGVLPLKFTDPGDYARLQCGQTIELRGIRSALERGDAELAVYCAGRTEITVTDDLTAREREAVLAGGLVNLAT